MTYQGEIPLRRAHDDVGQTTALQLPIHRLPHPTSIHLIGEGDGRHPDALDRLIRSHIEQALPPSHQRQHPPVVEGCHDHSRRKAAAPQPLQPLQERLQLGLVGQRDAVPPLLRLALHDPPGVGGKSAVVVAEVEPAGVPAAIG